jgi:prolyl-tRNA synthetase
VAPVQVIIIPIIFKESEEVLEACEKVRETLEDAGIRVKTDASDRRPGAKYFKWEMQGVPIRLELGPRDLKNNAAMLVRRDTGEKESVPLSDITAEVRKKFGQIQDDLYTRASQSLEEHIFECGNVDEIKEKLSQGIVKSYWCGTRECGLEIEEAVGAGILGLPGDQQPDGDKVCCLCGAPATDSIYIARTY